MNENEKNKVVSASDKIDSLSLLSPEALVQQTTNFNVSYDFTEEEIAAIDDLAGRIDIMDVNSLINYGSAAQNEAVAFDDKRLSNSATSELGEAGKALTSLVVDLKGYSNGENEKNPLMKIFKSNKRKLEEFQRGFASIKSNIDETEKILRNHLDIMARNIKEYDEAYEMNLDYYKVLTMYIAAAKKKLEELKTVDLPAAINKANETKSTLDTQLAKDLADAINSFEKKILSLEISRQRVIHEACQCKVLQKSFRQLSEQIIDMIANGIPAWKSTMRNRLGIEDAKRAQESISLSSQFINEQMKENMDVMSDVYLKIEEQSSKPVIEVETIEYINNKFIDMLNGIVSISVKDKDSIQRGFTIIEQIEQKRNAALIEFSNSVAKVALESAQKPLGVGASKSTRKGLELKL